MRCSRCNSSDTRVLESRLSHEGRSVRRRRQCAVCSYRFTTYEKEEAVSFQIRKRDHRVEPYVREKSLRSLQLACRKRNISLEQLEVLLDRIERTVQERGERVIESQDLGQLLLENLHGLDKVAYVRFASVYKDFQDIDEFMTELEAMAVANHSGRLPTAKSPLPENANLTGSSESKTSSSPPSQV